MSLPGQCQAQAVEGDLGEAPASLRYRRQGLQACSWEELLSTLDITTITKILAPDSAHESQTWWRWVSLHTSRSPPLRSLQTRQGRSQQWVCLPQLLRRHLVTSGDIQRQTRKVKKDREAAYGLESRQACQGGRESKEPNRRKTSTGWHRAERCGPRHRALRETAQVLLDFFNASPVSCSKLCCFVVLKLYFIKLF